MAEQNDQQDGAGAAPSDTGQADYGSAGGQAGADVGVEDDDLDDADLGLEEDPDVAEVFGDDPQAQA